MAPIPKFIQLTCSSVVRLEDGRIAESLFALEEDGNVWRFSLGKIGYEDGEWIRLPAPRK